MTNEDAESVEGRYAAFTADDGAVVIYDTEVPGAWISSDVTMANWGGGRRRSHQYR